MTLSWKTRTLMVPLDEQLARLLAWAVLALLLFWLALPLAAMLGKAFLGDRGEFVGLARIADTLAQPGLATIVGNSLSVALATVLLVLPLAYAYAAALTRVALPGRGLFRLLALLPLLAPSLLPGISLVYLFGHQGLLKSWLADGSIYGWIGIVLGEAFYTFPHALMILLTALALEIAPPAQAIGNIVGHAQIGKQRIRLEHNAVIALGGRQPGDVAARQPNLAVIGHVQPGNLAQQGGFAATGRAQQAHKLALAHTQVQLVEHGVRAKALGNAGQLQIRLGRHRHSGRRIGRHGRAFCTWAAIAR